VVDDMDGTPEIGKRMANASAAAAATPPPGFMASCVNVVNLCLCLAHAKTRKTAHPMAYPGFSLMHCATPSVGMI